MAAFAVLAGKFNFGTEEPVAVTGAPFVIPERFRPSPRPFGLPGAGAVIDTTGTGDVEVLVVALPEVELLSATPLEGRLPSFGMAIPLGFGGAMLDCGNA